MKHHSPSIPNYDIAGDGISTRDFVTVTAGARATEFCKVQCAATPECEFVVTQGPKCYLKANIGGGTYGRTGTSPLTDSSCVKGADNWLKFALQVSNQPAGGAPPPVAAAGPATGGGGVGGLQGAPQGGVSPLAARRSEALKSGGGGARRRAAGGAVAAAALAGWLLLS
jgi:hypothetical protein